MDCAIEQSLSNLQWCIHITGQTDIFCYTLRVRKMALALSHSQNVYAGLLCFSGWHVFRWLHNNPLISSLLLFLFSRLSLIASICGLPAVFRTCLVNSCPLIKAHSFAAHSHLCMRFHKLQYHFVPVIWTSFSCQNSDSLHRIYIHKWLKQNQQVPSRNQIWCNWESCRNLKCVCRAWGFLLAFLNFRLVAWTSRT